MKHKNLFHGDEVLDDTETSSSDCGGTIETAFTACLELSTGRVELELQIDEQRRIERLKELEALRERAKSD